MAAFVVVNVHRVPLPSVCIEAISGSNKKHSLPGLSLLPVGEVARFLGIALSLSEHQYILNPQELYVHVMSQILHTGVTKNGRHMYMATNICLLLKHGLHCAIGFHVRNTFKDKIVLSRGKRKTNLWLFYAWDIQWHRWQAHEVSFDDILA